MWCFNHQWDTLSKSIHSRLSKWHSEILNYDSYLSKGERRRRERKLLSNLPHNLLKWNESLSYQTIGASENLNDRYTWSNECVSLDLYHELWHVFIATKIIGEWLLKVNIVCDINMFIRSRNNFLFNDTIRKGTTCIWKFLILVYLLNQ